MRILVAPDKFKGTLSAREAAGAIGAGLREALPQAEITLLPIADGGEGTAEVIAAAQGGEWHECEVHDALGDLVMARFATIDGGETAIVETSAAIGLWRIAEAKRDLLRASSLGAGELILHAARTGARKIIAGLGGSATNDGGFGLARALGFRFLSRDGRELEDVLELLELEQIEAPPKAQLPRLIGAVDVRNPLLGSNGATRVYGAQKGGTRETLDRLEAALARLADVAARDLAVDHRNARGAGAAGGLGFGFATFCGASLEAGFEIVAEAIDLAQHVARCDIVITGEGCLDAQTFNGKAAGEMARMAQQLGKRCCAIVGQVKETPEMGEYFEEIVALSEAFGEAGAAVSSAARELAARLS